MDEISGVNDPKLKTLSALMDQAAREAAFHELDPFGERHGSWERVLHQFKGQLDRYVVLGVTQEDGSLELSALAGAESRQLQPGDSRPKFKRVDVGVFHVSDLAAQSQQLRVLKLLQDSFRIASAIRPDELREGSEVVSQLAQFAARLFRQHRGKHSGGGQRSIEPLVELSQLDPSLARGTPPGETKAGPMVGLRVGVLDPFFPFLTVLDQDEAGELYFLLSVHGDRSGPVFSWPVSADEITLPFFQSRSERHLYYVYLTHNAHRSPSELNVRINSEEFAATRRACLTSFFEELDSGRNQFIIAAEVIEPR